MFFSQLGQKVKIQLFRTLYPCISNKRESRMQQHGSKYFAHRPPPPPPPTHTHTHTGDGINRSDHGHVAYQIKDRES